MSLRAFNLALAIGMAAAGVAHAQTVAPNPGGAVVVTNSTTDTYVTRDMPVTQTVDDFSTTLTAVLNGGQTVFSQTYALPFSDPAVQAGVAAADAILAQDHALASAPDLSSSTTTQTSTVSDSAAVPTDVLTGSNPPAPYVITTTTFGPATITVGDNHADLFHVLAGQSDINIDTILQFYADVTVTTTNTDLTTSNYIISGSVGAAPEPSTWALTILGVGLIGAGLRHGRRPVAAPPADTGARA